MLFKKVQLPGLFGAVIEYYNIALYIFMAPVLVEQFFPFENKSYGYFFIFSVDCLAAVMQLCGARFFGKIGDTRGRSRVLNQTILGTSLVTGCILFVPTYADCGWLAAVLFSCLRLAQCFFAGGEYNGGAIYCLEHETNTQRHGLLSGLYCALVVMGMLLANAMATLISYLGTEYFRIAYVASFMLVIVTIYLRRSAQESPAFLNKTHAPVQTQQVAQQHSIFITAVLVSVFFSVIYGIPSQVLNALVPMMSDITRTQVLAVNTCALVFYAVALLFFGWYSDRQGCQHMMSKASLCAAVCSVPLFLLIQKDGLVWVVCAKFVFVFLAAAFIAPYHAWVHPLFATHQRYQKVSMSFACGKILARLLMAMLFLMFDKTQDLLGLGLILMGLGLYTFLALKKLGARFGPAHSH